MGTTLGPPKRPGHAALDQASGIDLKLDHKSPVESTYSYFIALSAVSSLLLGGGLSEERA